MEKAFNCKMCGQCCQGNGGIVATIEEQMAMADFLNICLSEFQDQYIRKSKDKFFVQTSRQGTCLFFIPDQGCRVHPVKPRTCRAWPFFRGNLMDESSFDMAREYCSGINPDISFNEFVRQGISYLEEHSLTSEMTNTPANALNISGVRGQGAEGRRLKEEGRRLKAEGRRKKAEGRRKKAEG
ncbi:YkgJ family cysteine cluster protein [Desulfonatronovibrio magnus]|uniref:YkgJ family cysteine cluster protein n=1 Tax=Desulfonatronovibrio magnus TaxID=698827 RepID=UPI000AE5DE11|nr:YkgJ family cysteine cluster protein [Desulfonatronovibrio magnus]